MFTRDIQTNVTYWRPDDNDDRGWRQVKLNVEIVIDLENDRMTGDGIKLDTCLDARLWCQLIELAASGFKLDTAEEVVIDAEIAVDVRMDEQGDATASGPYRTAKARLMNGEIETELDIDGALFVTLMQDVSVDQAIAEMAEQEAIENE